MNLFNNIDQSKKRLLIIIGVIFIVLTIILIIVFVATSLNQNPAKEYEITDPSSQEAITTTSIAGQLNDSPIRFGFRKFYDYHTDDWIEGVVTIINLYAREHSINLERISIVKDSYLPSQAPEWAPDTFSITLNIDQEELSVHVPYTTNGASVILYSNGEIVYEKEMVYKSRYIKLDGSLPSWLNAGPILRTQFDSDLQLLANSGLPPAKDGESIRAYFACPLYNQAATDGCYVYKYDLYY